MSFTMAAIALAAKAAETAYQNYENRKAASRANRYNYAMWEAQNEYNKPINQMARLKEAGLNPNLAYGSLASSAAGSTPRAEVPAVPNYQNLGDLVGNYQDIKQRDATTEQVKATTQATKDHTKNENKLTEQDLINKQNSALLQGQQFANAVQAHRNLIAQNDILKQQAWRSYKRNKILEASFPAIQEKIKNDIVRGKFKNSDLGMLLYGVSEATGAAGNLFGAFNRANDFYGY